MRQPLLLAFAASIALTATSSSVSNAQVRPNLQRVPSYLVTKLIYRTGWSIPGKWTYRSWIDSPNVLINGDANTALSLLFGEGTMTLATPTTLPSVSSTNARSPTVGMVTGPITILPPASRTASSVAVRSSTPTLHS